MTGEELKPKKAYIAIRVQDMNPWLWFEREKVKIEDGLFHGENGWGRSGAATDISVKIDMIKSVIHSSNLQYT